MMVLINRRSCVHYSFTIGLLTGIFSVNGSAKAVWFHFGTDFGTLRYLIQVALSTSDTLPTALALATATPTILRRYVSCLLNRSPTVLTVR